MLFRSAGPRRSGGRRRAARARRAARSCAPGGTARAPAARRAPSPRRRPGLRAPPKPAPGAGPGPRVPPVGARTGAAAQAPGFRVHVQGRAWARTEARTPALRRVGVGVRRRAEEEEKEEGGLSLAEESKRGETPRRAGSSPGAEMGARVARPAARGAGRGAARRRAPARGGPRGGGGGGRSRSMGARRRGEWLLGTGCRGVGGHWVWFARPTPVRVLVRVRLGWFSARSSIRMLLCSSPAGGCRNRGIDGRAQWLSAVEI